MNEKIAASDLARGLGLVLERVLKGETFEVVRYGRVVALLGPVLLDGPRPGTKTIDPPRPQAPPSRVEKVSANDAVARQRRVDEILKGQRRSQE